MPAFDAPRAKQGESVPLFTVDDLPPTAGEYAEARLRDVFVRFSAFADEYTAVMEDDPSGGLVVGDVRYSMETAGFDAIWGLRIMPSDPFEPARFTGHGPPDREGALRDLWYDLIAPDARYAPIAATR